jgi:hypothetical protein
MPFRKYHSDPTHVEAMRLAFRKVCDALQLCCDEDDPATDLTPKGGPPALPGRQQKFDIYGGRPPEKLATKRHAGDCLMDGQRRPGHRGRSAIFRSRFHPQVLQIDKVKRGRSRDL